MGGFFSAFYGEPEPTASPQEESDKMLALELSEKLRRKVTKANTAAVVSAVQNLS